jgi:hypothetical protein
MHVGRAAAMRRRCGGGARSVRITRLRVAAPKPGTRVRLINTRTVVPGFWVCVRAIAQQRQQLSAVGPQPTTACNSYPACAPVSSSSVRITIHASIRLLATCGHRGFMAGHALQPVHAMHAPTPQIMWLAATHDGRLPACTHAWYASARDPAY